MINNNMFLLKYFKNRPGHIELFNSDIRWNRIYIKLKHTILSFNCKFAICSSHTLEIKRGRHTSPKTPVANRKCLMCDEIEDERLEMYYQQRRKGMVLWESFVDIWRLQKS